MEIRVQRYESQVKLFLVLLVLFLAAVGIVGLNVLTRTQTLLLEEAEGRVTAATRAVQREIGESTLLSGLPPAAGRVPADSVAVSSRLSSLARAYALSSVEIVDLQGAVIASSQPWRAGVVDPVAADVGARELGRLATGAVIREPDTAADDAEYGPDRGEVFVFLPLGSGPSGPTALLKAGHEVMGVRTVARQIRSLAWMQAGTGLIVLALVFLFARWVLRPYRALKAA
ncbi:MAG TPA: hypothetical protein VFG76_07805, partial [Candidatus Polarisedimenticolia bacterium]|nr:hypothetical protein [Candidatus Polarisedimenticolia bacterium]